MDAPREWTVEDGWSCLAPYATLSPQFLEAVQRRVWRSLDISNYHLEECARHLSQGRRCPGCLRKLTFRVDLAVVETRHFEQPVETAAASDEFGLHMRRLFDMLCSLEKHHENQLDMGGAYDIHLHLADVAHLKAPGDMGYNNYERCRNDHTRITLPGADELLLVHYVQHLSFGEWHRTPDPSVRLKMAARMPELTALDLVLETYGVQNRPPLRQDRQALAATLKVFAGQTLKMPSGDQSAALITSKLDSAHAQGYGLLSASLRGWSQRLIRFRVRGVVDGSLFWPHLREGGGGGGDGFPVGSAKDEPEWPQMQEFDIHIKRFTPSGGWCFNRSEPAYPAPATRDRTFESTGEDSDQDEEGRAVCRNVPHEERMQPLFSSWARALAHMPSLRTAQLRFRIKVFHEGGTGRGHSMEDWTLVYEAPGHKSMSNTVWDGKLGPEEQRCRRLIFHNTGGWRRVQETTELLQAVGSHSWPGTEMVVLTADRNKIVR